MRVYRIIDDAQSFQETSREGFELPVIGRLKSEALTVEDEGMRFLDVTEQEPFHCWTGVGVGGWPSWAVNWIEMRCWRSKSG